MPGPYINDGNYRFGVSEYNQPCPPGYDYIDHHRKPDFRQPAGDVFRDDGIPYTSYLQDNTNPCATCGRCNRIRRNKLVTSLVNLETSITKLLRVKLYGATQELNKTVLMKEGNKYCISYLTERGVATVTGTYRGVSTSVPEECVSYIGNYSSAASTAYICMDCSTAGTSDKRLIYIASIRYIEEVYDESDDEFFALTQEEKIKSMVLTINDAITTINNYINSNNTDEENPPSEGDETNPNKCNCWCCNNTNNAPSGSGGSESGSEAEEKPDFNALVKAMENVRAIMNSFISAYDIDQEIYGYVSDSYNDCCCNNGGASLGTIRTIFKESGVPIVDKVPTDATDRGLYIVEKTEDGSEEDLGDIELK